MLFTGGGSVNRRRGAQTLLLFFKAGDPPPRRQPLIGWRDFFNPRLITYYSTFFVIELKLFGFFSLKGVVLFVG
jgi:hypothetical protein